MNTHKDSVGQGDDLWENLFLCLVVLLYSDL